MQAAQHYSSESPFAVANQTAAPATVRAAQAPGGSSTLSFGDDGEATVLGGLRMEID